jgi:membrane protein YdbS with pleckstrin-like domain
MAETAANVGAADRGIRIILGLTLVLFGVFCPFAHAQGPVVWIGATVIGAVLLVTAALRICPLYRMLGTRTN